jgi:hypothetical protein
MRKMRIRPVTVLRSTLTPVYRLMKMVMMFRYWVVTTLAPRMTTANTTDGEPKALKKSMLFKCLNPILATCWCVSARRGKIGRYGDLVKPD